MSCLGNTLTKSSDLFQDRISRRRPDEGMRSTVVMTHVPLDLSDKGFDTPECSAANSSLGDDVEPDFHLI